MNNDFLIETLTKQRDEIKDKIDNYQKYNQINKLRRMIIKTGIAIDYAFPFILSLIIMFNLSKKVNNKPFIIDEIEEKEKIEIIDASSGYHCESEYYGEDTTSRLEYSEGWKFNEYGLFERKVTSYILYNININDKEKILSMSKEELDSHLIKLSEDIYTKAVLSKKDELYLTDNVIFTQIKVINTKTIKETKENNALSTIIFIIFLFLLKKSITKVDRIIFRDVIINKLRELEYSYREIDKDELNKLKDILEIRNENLDILKVKSKGDYHGKHIR